MAIQFPNFLGVPVRAPDYSGIGDVVNNYYAGKAMPKDDLIKAIQAQFARPNAEQTLLSSKLSNRKSQLDIDKAVQEMSQQKAFEQQLSQALKQGGGASAGEAMGGGGSGGMSSPQVQAMSQALQGTPPLQSDGIDPTKMDPRYRKFDQQATGLPMSAYKGQGNAPMASPVAEPAPMQSSEPELHEVTIAKGSPHLAGVDQLWENNPLSREFLKKKGYEKKQDIKFNNKTGQTTITTTYPSGRISVQTSAAGSATGEAPLTGANVTKQQNIISSIDNTLPVIEDILTLDKGEFEPYPRNSGLQPGLGWVPGYMSKSSNYEAMVSSALDTLLGAYGLPKTNEGIETVKKQLLIGHGESDSAYKARLRNLVKDLNRRKSYSANLLKKTITNPPVINGAEYSNTDWEPV